MYPFYNKTTYKLYYSKVVLGINMELDANKYWEFVLILNNKQFPHDYWNIYYKT